MLKKFQSVYFIYGPLIMFAGLLLCVATWGNEFVFITVAITIWLPCIALGILGIILNVRICLYNKRMIAEAKTYEGVCPCCQTKYHIKRTGFIPSRQFPEGFTICKPCKQKISFNNFSEVTQDVNAPGDYQISKGAVWCPGKEDVVLGGGIAALVCDLMSLMICMEPGVGFIFIYIGWIPLVFAIVSILFWILAMTKETYRSSKLIVGFILAIVSLALWVIAAWVAVYSALMLCGGMG